MKQKLLDFIRANPMVSLEAIRDHMRISKSATSDLLIQAVADGDIDFQGRDHNRKCYYIKTKTIAQPYQIEKTLWRVKEISSLFIAL